MIQLLAFLLCFMSFTGFALAKTSHYKAVFAVRVDTKLSQLILVFSWITLIASALASMWYQFGYGSLLFCGYMAISVLSIALILSYQPAKLRLIIYTLPGFIVTVFGSILL